MNSIVIKDPAVFRQAVMEQGFAVSATAIPSISGGNDGPRTFVVIVNGISLDANVGYVHELPFVDNLIGATVLIGVFDRDEKLDKIVLPDGFNRHNPVGFTVRITDDNVEGDFYAYDYEVLDSTLRLCC